jgi:hypothetical protein
MPPGIEPTVEAKRRQLLRRFTIVGLVPLLISAGLFVYVGVTDHDATVLIPVILIAATMFFGWRAPGHTGTPLTRWRRV